MAGKTNISWTDAVWNPSVGCTRVSSGCDHCYAFALHDRRYAANKKAAGNKGIPSLARPRVVMPFPLQYDVPFSRLQLLPDRLDAPLRWRKPRRVFVNSMSDLFHEEVPDTYIHDIFGVMILAGQHTFQVLTKRPERMKEWMARDHSDAGSVVRRHLGRMGYGQAAFQQGRFAENAAWPPPNVWLGISCEDQATADERIPLLLETPAAVRFVSAEPLLGPVDLHNYFQQVMEPRGPAPRIKAWQFGLLESSIDWLIVGGETGKGYRPMNLDWARSLRDQCQAAGVPYFYKQGSGPLPGKNRELDGRRWEEYP